MRYLYHVVNTTVQDELHEPKIRYGVAFTASEPDMFGEREAAERLANLCNQLSLDFIHFPDVIEDFLVEYYS